MTQFSTETIRSSNILFIMSNITVSVITILLTKIKLINNTLTKFYYVGIKKKSITNVIFFTLLIIGFSYLIYNIGLSTIFNREYIINFIVFMIFIIVTYIFIENQNKYKKLEDDYDNLFQYIQNFEDWIEKEQLNRHEYNQRQLPQSTL